MLDKAPAGQPPVRPGVIMGHSTERPDVTLPKRIGCSELGDIANAP